jgi:hypothetical protein
MDRLTRIGIATLSACLMLYTGAASAQTRSAQPGPLVLEPISDGPVFAPEVKFTRFDHNGGTLVGGYGGWLVDNRLLVGAAFDVLVDHNYHDPVAGMGYGGFLAGWMIPASRVFHAGVRALVGFGEATVTDTFSYPVPLYGRHGVTYPPGTTVVQQAHFSDGFFIFEPQGTAVVRLSRAFAIDVAGGYRLISGTGIYNGRLSGPSVSVGVRVGPSR